jgi:hypothetical protein
MTSTQVRPDSTPQIAVNDIGTAEDFLAAIDQTIKYFNDGDMSCPSSTTSTPPRWSRSATRWKPSSSRRRTRKGG